MRAYISRLIHLVIVPPCPSHPVPLHLIPTPFFRFHFIFDSRLVAIAHPQNRVLWVSAPFIGIAQGTPIIAKSQRDAGRYVFITHNVHTDDGTIPAAEGFFSIFTVQPSTAAQLFQEGAGSLSVSDRAPYTALGVAHRPVGNNNNINNNDLFVWMTSTDDGTARSGYFRSFQLPIRFDPSGDDLITKRLSTVSWSGVAAPTLSENGLDLFAAVRQSQVQGWVRDRPFTASPNLQTQLDTNAGDPVERELYSKMKRQFGSMALSVNCSCSLCFVDDPSRVHASLSIYIVLLTYRYCISHKAFVLFFSLSLSLQSGLFWSLARTFVYYYCCYCWTHTRTHMYISTAIRSSPTLSIDQSRLFSASAASSVSALDSQSGWVLWTRQTESRVLQELQPSLDDRFVYGIEVRNDIVGRNGGVVEVMEWENQTVMLLYIYVCAICASPTHSFSLLFHSEQLWEDRVVGPTNRYSPVYH